MTEDKLNLALRVLEEACDKAARQHDLRSEELIQAMLRTYLATRLVFGNSPEQVFSEVNTYLSQMAEDLKSAPFGVGPKLGGRGQLVVKFEGFVQSIRAYPSLCQSRGPYTEENHPSDNPSQHTTSRKQCSFSSRPFPFGGSERAQKPFFDRIVYRISTETLVF